METKNRFQQIRYAKVKECQLRYDIKGDLTSESKTQQEFRESSDINNIINKYKKTGILSSGDIKATRSPQYGDFMNTDYVEMHRTIANVQEKFGQLAATKRKEFDNKPELWLAKLEEDEIKRLSDEAEAIEKENSITTDPTKTEETTEVNKTTVEEKSETEEPVTQNS